MKHFTLLFLFILSLNFCFAQKDKSTFKEQLFEAKALEIKETLNLSDRVYNAFYPIYKRYDDEITKAFSENRPAMSYAKAIETDVDAITAATIINSQFVSAEKVIAVKRKYLQELGAIFTGTDLIKFYQTETIIRNKIKKEFNSRKQNQNK